MPYDQSSQIKVRTAACQLTPNVITTLCCACRPGQWQIPWQCSNHQAYPSRCRMQMVQAILQSLDSTLNLYSPASMRKIVLPAWPMPIQILQAFPMAMQAAGATSSFLQSIFDRLRNCCSSMHCCRCIFQVESFKPFGHRYHAVVDSLMGQPHEQKRAGMSSSLLSPHTLHEHDFRQCIAAFCALSG